MVRELLDPGPSVGKIGAVIVGYAADNPFFIEEITHDLAELAMLVEDRDSYACCTDIGEIGLLVTL
ncbi:hypothetical protein [Mycobacterium uberis]|uniref:hypothetical protein n=1 Tax=Mycobacterium uberis TaxID=2162698 RepID=UPI001FB21F34|nr:hypothetical protein [Mycobacterium uberis]